MIIIIFIRVDKSHERPSVFIKGQATHSNTLAWKIPWTEEPGRLQYGVAKSRTRLSDFTHSYQRKFLFGSSMNNCHGL